MKPSAEPGDLLNDPLLREVPVVEGFKVLDPAVLYAKIGQGGMGAIYRGRHCQLDLDVAVKCLLPSLAAADPTFVTRFEREAQLAASLTHQNVVRVIDVQSHLGLHYLVMEFVRGESLRERVLRKGRLGEAEALAILTGACTGLAEAHAAGIVHRDIKPDNLLISIEGRVKVADLGIARSVHATDAVTGPAVPGFGSHQYMPPEQWQRPDVGPTADVWALGATLYFMLVGRPAIVADSVLAMAKAVMEQPFPDVLAERSDLRPEVVALLARCVQRDPAARFADAAAMLPVLRALGPLGEADLRDPAAEAGGLREPMVTPPPRDTILRIRAALSTEVAAGPSSLLPTEVRPWPGPDRPAPGATGSGPTRLAPAPAVPAGAVPSPAVPNAPPIPVVSEPRPSQPSPRPPEPKPEPEPQPQAKSEPQPAPQPRFAVPVAAGRRWLRWLFVVLALAAAAFAVHELTRDRRVHPVTEPLLRPIDDYERRPTDPIDPAGPNGASGRRPATPVQPGK